MTTTEDKRPTQPTKRLRDLFSKTSEDSVIFATDVLSQPKGKRTIEYDFDVHHQCARSLPIARRDDIILLSAALDEPYYEWLKAHDLTSHHVISYNQEKPRPLSDLIKEDPEPIRRKMEEIGKPFIFVPYYCSDNDITCAELLGIPAFGCKEAITRKYFNKVSFKEECKRLEIPMVDGGHHELQTHSPLDQDSMAEIVQRLLANYGKVLIRGAEDSNTRSFFVADSPDIQDLYDKLVANQDESVLIEPLMNVISSPNAQWIIDLEGKAHFIGITAQQFQGFKWAGNMSGQYYSKRVFDYIKKTSKQVVEQMQSHDYRGVIGIDYIVCEEGIFPIENNARLTGSTFAVALTDEVRAKIPDVRCWKFYKAHTTPCSFDDLCSRIGNMLYDGIKVNSVFPFLTDLLEKDGSLIVHLFAEDMYHIDFMQEALAYAGITRT